MCIDSLYMMSLEVSSEHTDPEKNMYSDGTVVVVHINVHLFVCLFVTESMNIRIYDRVYIFASF